jgi:iron complex outermembrane receptor protein
MKPRLHTRRRAAALVLALTPSLAALAAEKTPEGLEEIVVTAQKRSESLQDVPISIMAYGEETLDNFIANSIGDIDEFTPNLEVDDGQVTQPGYRIRGIGTGDFGVGLEPAVGVYIDGVYVGRSGSSRVAFNDVERVEVLNGPQGTLFGRNAAAGAIQVITHKPVAEEEGWAKATIGNYGKLQLEGVYNLPLASNVFLRMGALSNERDGWINDTGEGPDRADEQNWSVNAALRWLPRADLDVIFRVEYDDIDQTSAPDSSATLGPRHKGPNYRKMQSDGVPDETRELFGTSAHVEWDLGEAQVTSISAYRGFNSYNRRDKDGSAEKRYYFEDLNDEDNEMFSQELRIESTGDSRLRWTAGGSYFWESAKQEGGVFIGPQTADQLIWDLQIAPLLGLPYEESVVAGVRVPAFVGAIGGLDAESCAGGAGCVLYPGAGLDFFKNSILSPFRGLAPGSLGGRQLVQQVDYWLDSFKIDGEYRSYAVFGDVSYDLSEMFTLTGGLRYTKDEKEFARRIEFNPYGVPIAFQEETLIDADGNYDPDNGTLGWYRQDHSWDEVTSRVVLDMHLTDDIMLYASWSNGYKSGGYNSAGPTIDEGPLAPETVENIEAGLKSSFFDNRLRVNGAIYDYTYKDLQRQVFIPGECRPGGLGAYEFTSDDVKGSGYELDVTWMIVEGLTVGANTGKVDAEYTRSISKEVVNGVCIDRDRKGAGFANSPSNYNIFANLDLPFSNGGIVSLSVNYSYGKAGRSYGCKYVSPEGYLYDLGEDANGVLQVTRQSADGPALTEAPFSSCPNPADDEYMTARAAYVSGDGKWEAAVYAQNLMRPKSVGGPGGLGDSLRTAYFDGSPTYGTPPAPEFYGVELKYAF